MWLSPPFTSLSYAIIRNSPHFVWIRLSPARTMYRSFRSRYRISSATVSIISPCSLQNGIRSGIRAISPSSRIISQITPEGFSPASRARSTEASVCPARTSTPPLRALKREHVSRPRQVRVA